MLIKHFTTVSFYTILSRISGYVRDIFIAKYLGAGPLSDAFLIALRVPNFFRRFFAEGALNSAFIPLFSRQLETEGREAAKRFAEEIFVLLFITLVIFSSVFMLFMPYLIYLIAPGFSQNPETQGLVVELTRITFPYLMLISIATLFAGILNSISKFASVAFMPVLFNIAIIFAMLVLGQFFSSLVHAMAWGVFLAGILQIIWMIYFLHKNGWIIALKFRALKLSANVREFLRKVMPTAVGGSVVQINLWVDMMVASFFSGAVTYLYYADRISQLPLSIVGTAMGTALLPLLSRKLGAGEIAEANKIHETGLEVVMLLTLPATFALVVLHSDIMTILFQRGEFTAENAAAASYALVAFSLGLPAFALVKIFATSFFALKDTKTPVVSACIAMVVNVILNITFVLTLKHFGYMPHIGIALATACSSWVNATMLGTKLFRTTHFSLSRQFVVRMGKIIISTVAMTAILIFSIIALEVTTMNLAIKIISGGGTYVAMILLLKTFDLNELKTYLTRKKGKAPKAVS